MSISSQSCYKISRSKIPSRILRQESDSEDTVCETDVALAIAELLQLYLSLARHDLHG